MIIKSNGNTDSDHVALRPITIVPYIPAPLSEQFEDKVSNATILRTIRFNVNEWMEWAKCGGSEYTNGRADAYQKVLDLLDSIKGGLK